MKLYAILLIVSLLVVAGCAQAPAPQAEPEPAPAGETEDLEELDTLEEELSDDDLAELDDILGDIENI